MPDADPFASYAPSQAPSAVGGPVMKPAPDLMGDIEGQTRHRAHDSLEALRSDSQQPYLPQEVKGAKEAMDLLGLALSPFGGTAAALYQHSPAATQSPSATRPQQQADLAGDVAEGVVPLPTEAVTGPARAMARVADPVVRRLVEASHEAFQRLRMMQGYERGAAPTEAMRAAAQKPGVAAVGRLARRLDPTGEKLRFNPREARGKPVTAAEALGRPAEVQLKVAGRRMGQTSDALETQLRSRHAETSERVVKDFGDLTGVSPEAAEGDFVSEMEKLRQKAGPLYDRAYAHTDVESPRLTDLLKRPSMQEALDRAEQIAAEEGRDPKELGLERRQVQASMDGRPLTSADGKPIMTEQSVQISKPSMQTWDYVKRGMDDVIEGYRKNGKLQLDTRGRAVVSTLHDLRAELTNPETAWGNDYRAALDAGGEPLRQEEAFKAAPKLMSSTVPEREFNDRLAKYTPAQMDAMKAGIVNQVRNAAQAGRQRLAEMTTPAYKAKLARVFGAKVAEELGERIEDERFLMAHGQRMTPGIGSDTSETLLGDEEQRSVIKEVTKAARSGNWGKALLSAISSPIVGAYRGAQLPLDEATRDVIGALLSKSPSELARVLEAQGATPGEAAHVASTMKRGGFFSPQRQATMLLQLTRGVVKSAEPPPNKSTADAPKDDPFARFAQPAAPTSAATPPVASADAPAPDPASDKPEPAASAAPPDSDMKAEPAAFTPDNKMQGYLAYHLGVPNVEIHSSYRSARRNAEVGGAPQSAHTRGEAWDFSVPGMSMEEAGQKLAQSGMLFDQIEITPTHVHISFDPRNRGQIIHEGRVVGHANPNVIETSNPSAGPAPAESGGAEDYSDLQMP